MDYIILIHERSSHHRDTISSTIITAVAINNLVLKTEINLQNSVLANTIFEVTLKLKNIPSDLELEIEL